MAKIENYVSQIQAGEVTYDIAVAHGITFKYGSADASPVTWNGTDDEQFVVTIPNVTDIIQSPVIFAGTVDSNGTVTYVSGITATPTKGYLVYITESCTFGGQACEAGDMAVYDGTTWRVIQGENQVQLVGTPVNNVISVALGKSATNVITVEGKTLALNVDLSDLRDNVNVAKNAQSELNVTNAKVTVSSINIDLEQGNDSTVTVAEAKSFDLPTALASGAVTINESVLTASDVNSGFMAGSFPTISKNASAVTINASTGISIGKAGADGATGDYVTSVTAIQGVTFAAGTSSSNHLAYVAGLTAASGTEFVSGIHAYTDADQSKTADLIIPGAITADSANNTFVTGLETANAAGDNTLVSSITVGTVTVDTSGNSFLAGLSKGGNAVVTSVSLGTAVKDTTAQWFYDGLTTGTDVVTDVTVGAVSLVADNGGSPAIISASVSDHVLSFNTANFQTPVAISQASSTISKKGFTKAGVSLSGFDSESDVFTKAGISQAATTIAYKSITTGAVNLTVGASTSYFFDKAEDHAYAAEMGYKLIQTTDASVSRNTPVLENTSITATIPADTVAVALTGGTLPSLSISAATGTLTGSVPTALASTPYEFSAVSASAAKLTIPGAYSLVSVSEGGVAVGKAGEYSSTGGKITLAADTMVTDVYVDGTAVSKLS